LNVGSNASARRRRRRAALVPAGVAGLAATLSLLAWPAAAKSRTVTDDDRQLSVQVPARWQLADGGDWGQRLSTGRYAQVGEASIVVGHPDARRTGSGLGYLVINEEPWLFAGLSSGFGAQVEQTGLASVLDQLDAAWNVGADGRPLCAAPTERTLPGGAKLRTYTNCPVAQVRMVTLGRPVPGGLLYVQVLAAGDLDVGEAEALATAVAPVSA
jgi:hypothetical protein